VAHAGVNRVILCEALSLSLEHLFRLDQNHGCLNIIDYFADFTVVRLINGGVNGFKTVFGFLFSFSAENSKCPLPPPLNAPQNVTSTGRPPG
jgi:hypothetical protein